MTKQHNVFHLYNVVGCISQGILLLNTVVISGILSTVLYIKSHSQILSTCILSGYWWTPGDVHLTSGSFFEVFIKRVWLDWLCCDCLLKSLVSSRIFSLDKPSLLNPAGSVLVKQGHMDMQQLQQRAAMIPPMVSHYTGPQFHIRFAKSEKSGSSQQGENIMSYLDQPSNHVS